MISYEITAEVRADLIEKFESFMQEKHIPDLIKTGCFENAKYQKISAGNFRICYLAKTREKLNTYLKLNAEDLRQDFIDNFPEGIKISREIIEK
ncbi:MAG: DUF4286 family protein [Pyrinomonadaceae bacterium]|nr:DUF4286 family protein [Pyrinomonadaceae bacterium]